MDLELQNDNIKQIACARKLVQKNGINGINVAQ